MRTVWLDIWDRPPDGSADTMVEEIRTSPRPPGTQVFDEPGSDDEESRLGYWYVEGVEGHVQWSLYAYTFRPDCFVQAAFIASTPDSAWALDAWRSLRFVRAS